MIIKSISIEASLVDLTNPAAANWTQNIIINNLIKEAGAIGWMSDFGEYAPLTAHYLNAQKDSVTEHNRNPLTWAQVNKDAIKKAGKEDEIVWFLRAGCTMVPGAAQLFWMGD